MKSRINREAREISISELWWYVISKWKWLVIGMVVGAILLGAYGVYSAYKANEAARNNVSTEYTMEDLTPEEQEEVEELIEKYEHYQNEEERLENNYLMGLDYTRIRHRMVSFYIDTEYSYSYLETKEDYTDTLVYLYKILLQSDEVNQKILDLNISGLELIDLNYIRSVGSEGNVIKFAIMADEDECGKIVDVLCEELEGYYSDATELVGEHTIRKITDDSTYAYSDTIRNIQNLRVTDVNSMLNEINILKGNLNEIQKYVYEEMVSEYEQNSNSEQLDINNSLMDIKKILIGCLLGVVVVIIVIVIVFTISKKIRSISEITQVYNVEVIGSIIRDCTNGKIILRKLYNSNVVGNESYQKEYVLGMLKKVCTSNQVDTIAICSSIKGKVYALEDAFNILGKTGIECKHLGNINQDIEALNQITECKNVIFIEQMNVSSKNEIEKQIDICDKLNINIIGMIVVI